MLLEIAFFPPVSYMAAIAEEFTLSSGGVNSSVPAKIWIEACENYQKQSYRNRCRICSAGGVESLSFPVVHEGRTASLPIRDIRVDYSTPWLIRFERTIVSAYESSPWFSYYMDDLFSILDSRPRYLFELDLRILEFFLNKTGITADIDFTKEYSMPSDGRYGKDLRGLIHPKRENRILESLNLEKPYWQVFSCKYGFMSDLSVMDLLFNEGPDSITYLKRL